MQAHKIEFYPSFQTAGYTPKGADATTAQCFNPITGERQLTPDRIKKYRQSYRH